jgi:hypothetical protein
MQGYWLKPKMIWDPIKKYQKSVDLTFCHFSLISGLPHISSFKISLWSWNLHEDPHERPHAPDGDLCGAPLKSPKVLMASWSEPKNPWEMQWFFRGNDLQTVDDCLHRYRFTGGQAIQVTVVRFRVSIIWVNYNISLTWIKAILGWSPLLTMISSEVSIMLNNKTAANGLIRSIDISESR